jgi:hypothetical protein
MAEHPDLPPARPAVAEADLERIRAQLRRCLLVLDAAGLSHAAAHLDLALHQLDRHVGPGEPQGHA